MQKLVIIAAIAACALALTACGTPASDTGKPGDSKDSAGQSPTATTEEFDFSTIKPDPEVVKLVPKDVKERDVLRNGASTDYAPLEMLKEDGTTPTGAEVDLTKAIALTMGLKDGTTTTETFAALLPKVGSTYDIGASGFTVTAERIKTYDMLAFKNMGTLFAVKKGNPSGFNPDDPCGATVGVQTGSYQEEDVLPRLNKECLAAGKPEIKIQKEDLVNMVIPKVISGQYDAVIADDPVTAYNVKKAEGQLETVGKIFDTTPLAIVVNKKNQDLSKAVKAAMDSLMKSGKFKEIMAVYGADGDIYPEVKLNPDTK